MFKYSALLISAVFHVIQSKRALHEQDHRSHVDLLQVHVKGGVSSYNAEETSEVKFGRAETFNSTQSVAATDMESAIFRHAIFSQVTAFVGTRIAEGLRSQNSSEQEVIAAFSDLAVGDHGLNAGVQQVASALLQNYGVSKRGKNLQPGAYEQAGCSFGWQHLKEAFRPIVDFLRWELAIGLGPIPTPNLGFKCQPMILCLEKFANSLIGIVRGMAQAMVGLANCLRQFLSDVCGYIKYYLRRWFPSLVGDAEAAEAQVQRQVVKPWTVPEWLVEDPITWALQRLDIEEQGLAMAKHCAGVKLLRFKGTFELEPITALASSMTSFFGPFKFYIATLPETVENWMTTWGDLGNDLNQCVAAGSEFMSILLKRRRKSVFTECNPYSLLICHALGTNRKVFDYDNWQGTFQSGYDEVDRACKALDTFTFSRSFLSNSDVNTDQCMACAPGTANCIVKSLDLGDGCRTVARHMDQKLHWRFEADEDNGKLRFEECRAIFGCPSEGFLQEVEAHLWVADRERVRLHDWWEKFDCKPNSPQWGALSGEHAIQRISQAMYQS